MILANVALLFFYIFKPMNTNIALFNKIDSLNIYQETIQYFSENPPYMMADLEPYFVFDKKGQDLKLESIDSFKKEIGKWLFVDKISSLKSAILKSCKIVHSSVFLVDMLIEKKLIKDKSKGLFLLECP